MSAASLIFTFLSGAFAGLAVGALLSRERGPAPDATAPTSAAWAAVMLLAAVLFAFVPA